MPILNRAPPNRTRFYVESANAKALTIRNLGHFTAHNLLSADESWNVLQNIPA